MTEEKEISLDEMCKIIIKQNNEILNHLKGKDLLERAVDWSFFKNKMTEAKVLSASDYICEQKGIEKIGMNKFTNKYLIELYQEKRRIIGNADRVGNGTFDDIKEYLEGKGMGCLI